MESAAVLLMVLLNPFEINKWSQDRNRALWQDLHAHDYLGPMNRGDTPKMLARGNISLIYFDDASLARQKIQRPMSASVLQLLLSDIIETSRPGPRAIFVDMLLTDAAKHGMSEQDIIDDPVVPNVMRDCDRRKGETYSPFRCMTITVMHYTKYAQWKGMLACQANTLAKIACIEKFGGTPIIFADPRLGSSAAGNAIANIGSASLDALGKVAVIAPVAVEPARYPIWIPESERRDAYHPYWLSPAAALYAAWCGVGAPKADAQCTVNPAKTVDAEIPAHMRRYEWNVAAFGQDLDIEWGIGPRPTNNEKGPARHLSGIDCAGPETGLGATMFRLGRLATAGIDWPEKPKPCLYSRAFPYDILQANLTEGDKRALLSNKIVLVGGQFSDSNDVLDMPPFGMVPGAYFHAMAIDNLIQRGPLYPKAAEPIASWLDASTGDLANLPFFFFVALVLLVGKKASKVNEFPRWIGADWRRSTAWRLGVVMLATVAVFLILVLFLRFDARMVANGLIVPTQFNYVGATLIAMFGIVDLVWTACEPLRENLKHRFSPRRIGKALALISSGQPIPAAGPVVPSTTSNTSHEAKGNVHE